MLKSFQARLGLLFTFVFLLAGAAPATAAPGDLDPSFGGAGTRDIPSTSMAVQPDGKFVVVKGDSIIRYNPDGTLDTSFGFSPEGRVAYNDVAIHPDGRVVAVGRDLSANSAIAVRVNSNGSREFSQVDRWQLAGAEPMDVAIQADGGVLIAGARPDECNEFGTCDQSAFVTRLTPPGTVDPAFGGAGIATIDLGSGLSRESARAIAVQPDGKIVLVGDYSSSSVGSDGLVARLTETGALDSSFGSGGLAVVEFADNGTALRDVELDSHGRIVIAGAGDNAPTGPRQLVAGRLLADGSDDPQFGNGGWFVSGFTHGGDAGGNSLLADGTQLAIDGAGRVVFSGAVNLGPTTGDEEDIAVIRLGTDGQPDGTFGTNGTALYDFGGVHEEVRTMARQPDGGILVGTSQQDGNGFEIDTAMARVLTEDAPPPPPPTPSVSVSGTSLPEGDSGTSLASFGVTLSEVNATCDVTVDYATQDGSASSGSDYVATSGTLTIPSGSTSATVDVGVNGDAAVEPDEAFSLVLSNPTCATLGTSSADAMIENDDSEPQIVAPQIVGQTPAPGASGVSADTLVSVTFDQAVTTWSLVLTNDRGRRVNGSVSCNSPCTTVTLDPKKLGRGETYDVSASGSNGSGSDSASWSFTTTTARR